MALEAFVEAYACLEACLEEGLEGYRVVCPEVVLEVTSGVGHRVEHEEAVASSWAAFLEVALRKGITRIIRNKRPMGLDALLENQLGQNARCCTYTLFLPQGGSKLSLFLLYGEWFPRYELIFKIAIFGHETWPLAKVPEVAHLPTVYPQRVEIQLVLALQAAVSEIRADFQNCHIWG